MSNLSKLTIVMMTYNRPRYARRSIKFWSEQKCTLIILDGSKESLPEIDLNPTNENIKYYHLPISLLDRLKFVVGIVATEYIMLSGDDDFFLPSGLIACLQELEKNPDLISCFGRSMGFDYRNNKLVGWRAYEEMENYQINSIDPFKRMTSHMNPYTCSTVYSITRKHEWKICILLFSKAEYTPFNIDEVVFEITNSFLGKSKVIQTLLWLRSRENPPIRASDSHTKDVNYYIEGWWKNKSKKSEREQLLKTMSEELASSKFSQNDIENGLTDAFEAYVLEREKSSYQIFRNYFSSIMPEGVKKLLRFIRYGLFPVNIPDLDIPFKDEVDYLISKGVSIDSNDISSFQSMIENFHNPKSKEVK